MSSFVLYFALKYVRIRCSFSSGCGVIKGSQEVMEPRPYLSKTQFVWKRNPNFLQHPIFYFNEPGLYMPALVYTVFPIVCLPTILDYIIPRHLANIGNSSDKKKNGKKNEKS